MDYKTQVATAIKKGLIEGDYIKEKIVTDTSRCLSEEEQETVKKLSLKFEPNQCIDNSGFVMKYLNVPCCEGVAFIVLDESENQKNVGAWIKHAWNRKDDFYFDVTKEYVFPRNNTIPREIHHFLINEYCVEDYKKQKEQEGSSGFLSDAEKIKNILNKINDENKDGGN